MRTYYINHSLPASLALAIIVSLGFTLQAGAAPPPKQVAKRSSPSVARVSRRPSAGVKSRDLDSPDNHIEHCWRRSRFPLKVYFAPVEKGVWRFKKQYPQLMRQSFQEWTNATNNFAQQFQFVDAKPYDVKVVYVNETSHKRQGEAHYRGDFRNTTAAVINLAINKDADTNGVMHVGEHEIGHVLGLKHSLHRGVMMGKPGSVLEFISIEDKHDIQRIYRLDEEFQPLALNNDDREKYRISLSDALRKFCKTSIEDGYSDCGFTFEVDADGHIYNYKVNQDSPLRLDVLTILAKSDPLPKPPSYFCDHLKATGVLSGAGILEVRDLQPCN